MTNKERSVEEMAQAIYFKVKEMQTLAEPDTETILCIDSIKTLIQTERQKREEMVEAERERIIKKLEVYEDQEIFVPDIIEALTQPNNPN